ncbi:6-bladed beta-propeller [Belliella marina]|uniref:6-bladed beta-propeller n=1 Tax=Belliella marina TaxID=1644146 RepID=A0ABW4VJT6_9BACT
MNRKIPIILSTSIFLLTCGCKFGSEDKWVELYKDIYKGYEEVLSPEMSEIKTIGNDLTVITVPTDLKKKMIELDLLVDSVHYVHLETNEDVLLGDIKRILLAEDRIVTLELFSRHIAHIFDRNGNFISQLGIQGEGPNEYQKVMDVAINHTKHEILLMDLEGRKMMYYDFDGNHLRNERLYFEASNFTLLNDSLLLFKQSPKSNFHIENFRDHMLYLTDYKCKVQHYSIPSWALRYSKFPERLVYESLNYNTGQALYGAFLNDTIYEISGDGIISPKYFIDLGANGLMHYIDETTNNDDRHKLTAEKGYYHFDGKCLETDNGLYLKAGEFYHAYYSRSTGGLQYGGNVLYKSWFGKKMDLIQFNHPIASEGNFFISVTWPDDILRERPDPDEYVPHVADMIRKAEKDGNPILCFFSIKDF